jgi:hypothetical protein
LRKFRSDDGLPPKVGQSFTQAVNHLAQLAVNTGKQTQNSQIESGFNPDWHSNTSLLKAKHEACQFNNQMSACHTANRTSKSEPGFRAS